LSEPFNIFKFLNLSIEDGYSIYHNRSEINIKKCKQIYLSPSIDAYEIIKDKIYYFDINNGGYIIMHNTISIDEVKVVLKKYSSCGKLYYKKYDVEGKLSYGKCIKAKYNMASKRKVLIDNIIQKMEIHKNLTINIILYGEPGTGKSSFVEQIAQIKQSNIYVLPMSKETKLANIINDISTRDDSIILIPEIDKMLDTFGNPIHSENELYEFLDGSNRPNGSIVIITCNDIKKFKSNKTLSRPGRIHFEIEFELIEKSDIEFIIKTYYPDFVDFHLFDKYINKVSHAEFNTAICQSYIMNKDITTNFSITLKTQKGNQLNIYG
jgi:Cdc6-like AAA superfamily ATPase